MPEQFVCERIERPSTRPSIRRRIGEAWGGAVKTARLMIGVPDYPTYLEHCRKTHPDVPPMSYEAFFRSRMDARFGSKRAGCC